MRIHIQNSYEITSFVCNIHLNGKKIPARKFCARGKEKPPLIFFVGIDFFAVGFLLIEIEYFLQQIFVLDGL